MTKAAKPKTIEEIRASFLADGPRKCACVSREICDEARLKALEWFETESPWVTPEMMVAFKVGYAAKAMGL